MKVRRVDEDPGSRVVTIIREFVENSPENALERGVEEPAWDAPLVGFSEGLDPIYDRLKENIGEFLWTPIEAFSLAFPQLRVDSKELSIISWVLPQTMATKVEQRRQKAFPSQRWARARLFGEEFNNALRRHVTESLQAMGIAAVAPVLSPFWKRRESPRYGYASNWSERHAAFVSGLGTFGLSDGLITSVGKAVRVGSVVARLAVRPTPRPYENHHAYCLFHAKGICAKCADRCPAKAISRTGHDKTACWTYIRQITSPYVEVNFGFKANACGLCQTDVPCESGIPVKPD
ncbi:MAG: epoxyqueuosine reductase [Deltaproteobacteria bacterium]|nr:epoxyqueuosine reductase [Deltaproteobacteria bacterium]